MHQVGQIFDLDGKAVHVLVTNLNLREQPKSDPSEVWHPRPDSIDSSDCQEVTFARSPVFILNWEFNFEQIMNNFQHNWCCYRLVPNKMEKTYDRLKEGERNNRPGSISFYLISANQYKIYTKQIHRCILIQLRLYLYYGEIFCQFTPVLYM